MVIEIIFFILGLIFLVKGSNLIVDNSSALGKKLRISTLFIGLTLVAVGTSLPELVVNVFAGINGASDISIGNILGSNMSNILLVLGIAAITAKGIKIKKEVIWEQIPFALLAVFVLFVLSTNLFVGTGSVLGRKAGFIFLSLFFIYLYFIYRLSKGEHIKFSSIGEDNSPIFKILLGLLIGFVGIYFGGEWVVNGAIYLASKIGFSEFLISATAIAIGTSLPELAVSFSAVLKKDNDLAVGNIIGSNIFNIFWVLGITALINPINLSWDIGFQVGILFFSTLLLFVFMFIGKKHLLTKTEGVILLILYEFYIGYLVARG